MMFLILWLSTSHLSKWTWS